MKLIIKESKSSKLIHIIPFHQIKCVEIENEYGCYYNHSINYYPILKSNLQKYYWFKTKNYFIGIYNFKNTYLMIKNIYNEILWQFNNINLKGKLFNLCCSNKFYGKSTPLSYYLNKYLQRIHLEQYFLPKNV